MFFNIACCFSIRLSSFITTAMLLLFAVAQLVEALRYKSEGRGFNSSWGFCDFSLT
jgi:dolichyl-phosphate-mannose--protein O-mannosyl transferase